MRAFLETEEVQALLRQAGRVTIARDRERSPAKQAETDAAHDRQQDLVEAITGKPVRDWRPPNGCKDLAELNLRQLGREAPARESGPTR